MQIVTVKASIQIGGVVARRKTVTTVPKAIPPQLMRPEPIVGWIGEYGFESSGQPVQCLVEYSAPSTY